MSTLKLLGFFWGVLLFSQSSQPSWASLAHLQNRKWPSISHKRGQRPLFVQCIEEDQHHSLSMVLWIKPEPDGWAQPNNPCHFSVEEPSAWLSSQQWPAPTTSPCKLLCSLACSLVYLGVTGFRCYLDQTCLVMFIPSTACVLFCWHLLGMQGTKEINNIHPNVFTEVGTRKKYWFWPCRHEIQIRGIWNVKGLKSYCGRGRMLWSRGFQAGFPFWRLSASPCNAGPQGRTALCSSSLQRRVVENCRKSLMQWVSSEYHLTIIFSTQTVQFCSFLIYAFLAIIWDTGTHSSTLRSQCSKACRRYIRSNHSRF